MELDSRLACALYEAGKYVEAIQFFEGLFKREKLEDKQRLQVSFAFALIRTVVSRKRSLFFSRR